MQIELHHPEDGTVVARLNGKLTILDGVPVLREAFEEILKSGQKRILLNLTQLDYVDSSGIGAIVGGYARLPRGSVLILITDKKYFSQLLSFVERYPTEEEALASFR